MQTLRNFLGSSWTRRAGRIMGVAVALILLIPFTPRIKIVWQPGTHAQVRIWCENARVQSDWFGCTWYGSYKWQGDAFFGSGRPWYDVMAPPFNARNDGVTDDTAAIQLAITTACSTPSGGIIYFPRGAGYKTANTSVSPFVVSCSNLTFRGVQFAKVNSPLAPSTLVGASLTACMFSYSGNPNGIIFEYLGFSGNSASAGASAICRSGTNVYTTIQGNFFDSWGGPAILDSAPSNGYASIENNWAQNCLLQRPATTDTGCFDLSGADIVAKGNFVTTSVPTAAGNIGAGHTYSWAVRTTNGAFTNNFGEISQHGWLITGSYNRIIGNRSFLQQGNGFHVTSGNNVLIGNIALNSSQTATGTFDAFLCDTSCAQSTFSDNYIDDNANGNGNHTRNGITDNNSNGAGAVIGNKYSNNRIGAGGLTGTLYNMTGASPFSIQEPNFRATSAAFATATTAGTCVQNTTAVLGATTSMVAKVSPVSTPGVGAVWSAFVSSAGNVTINECAVATSAGGTIAFNIQVAP